MTDLKVGQIILFGGIEYTYDIDENGKSTLKTYDEDFKMCAILSFSENETDSEEELIEALSNEYLRGFMKV
ncbi:hypothetical protein MKX64_15420 [Paenibacillus sp. FSL M8-0334]|uniref:hypothetical protein n=1 Tax=Paenibacillus sp. FSL M8-0334 TaxID=2921623 RepID=UPI0030F8B0C5